MNEIIKGCGYHHMALRTNDLDKSSEFYSKLGFKTLLSWGEGDSRIVLMDMGDGTHLELFAGGKDEEPNGRFFHLAMKADDIEAAYNVAIAAGAVSSIEPKFVDLDSSPEKATLHIAFVIGPDGETLEFFERTK